VIIIRVFFRGLIFSVSMTDADVRKARIIAAAAIAGGALVLTVRRRVQKPQAEVAPAAAALPTDAGVLACWDKFAELYADHFRLWSAPAHCALVSALEVCVRS
jgi:hypothetical protein